MLEPGRSPACDVPVFQLRAPERQVKLTFQNWLATGSASAQTRRVARAVGVPVRGEQQRKAVWSGIHSEPRGLPTVTEAKLTPSPGRHSIPQWFKNKHRFL